MIHRFIIDVICVYLCIVPSPGKYSIKPDLFFCILTSTSRHFGLIILRCNTSDHWPNIAVRCCSATIHFTFVFILFHSSDMFRLFSKLFVLPSAQTMDPSTQAFFGILQKDLPTPAEVSLCQNLLENNARTKVSQGSLRFLSFQADGAICLASTTLKACKYCVAQWTHSCFILSFGNLKKTLQAEESTTVLYIPSTYCRFLFFFS